MEMSTQVFTDVESKCIHQQSGPGQKEEKQVILALAVGIGKCKHYFLQIIKI